MRMRECMVEFPSERAIAYIQRARSRHQSHVQEIRILTSDSVDLFLASLMKNYTHVYSWTRDRTAGVKSILCVLAGRAKGNVSADVASRTCNSRPLPFPLALDHNYY